FQAEDGIRDFHVTGVQTCALPICEAVAYPAASFERDFAWAPAHPLVDAYRAAGEPGRDVPATTLAAVLHAVHPGAGHFDLSPPRSEERRVGKGGRSGWSPEAYRHK